MNWPLLQNSLLLAGTTTVLAVGFALVAALWLATLEARWRNVFLVAAIVALALPPFLVTNCWISLLGDTGALRPWLPLKIYSLGGTIWILSLMLWPLTLLAMLAAWRRLEAEQFECEPAMTGLALVRWLLLPAARGEVALAAVLTFVLALNNFTVPAILQTKVLPDEMWVRFNTQFDAVGALKLSVPLVIAPVLLLAWIARRGVSWPRVQGTVSARVFRRQLGSSWRIVCGAVAILVCAFSAGLPLAQIVTAKRTWAELVGAVEASAGAIWNSFWFAALAATAVVVAALCFCLSRREEARASRASFAQRLLTSSPTGLLAWLPFFIPGVLIGIALIKVFNRPVLVVFYQSIGIVLLALVIRYFALAWTAARHATVSVDSELTDAAKLEGASRWQLFRFVVWPQIVPQMAVACYVVYLLCLWDVESIVLVQPPGGETLALKIFNLLHYGYAGQVNALCVVLLGVAVLPLVAWSAAKWLREKSSKLQHPSSRETSSSNIQSIVARLGVGAWSLALLWMLVLGAWCFCSGCSPKDSIQEKSFRGQFFDRALVIGSRGVGIGEFNKPRSVAVDLNDNIYAVDMTGRVQKFSPQGRFLLTWQMPLTELGKPKGMCHDRAGSIIVVEPHYQQVNQFTPDGQLLSQWGCKGTNAGCFMLPRSVAVNSRGEYLVAEYTLSERVQVFRSRAEGRGSGVELVRAIGRAGTEAGEFNRPEGICVDAHDRIYVADSCNHRIQIFSSDGKFIRQYGKAGSGLGELSYPYDIAVDADGYQFVCEFGNSRIQVFNSECEPVEIIGSAGTSPGQFNNPWDVALDSNGNLIVADALNHRVQKLVRRARQMGPMQPGGATAANNASRITHHVSR